MIQRLLVSWAVLAVAFALTAWLLPNVSIEGGALAVLWVAALFGLINAILGTILRLLTAPLIIFTLGLFSIVINALMIELTAHASSHLDVHGFWAPVWAAILISTLSTLIAVALPTFGRVREAR